MGDYDSVHLSPCHTNFVAPPRPPTPCQSITINLPFDDAKLLNLQIAFRPIIQESPSLFLSDPWFLCCRYRTLFIPLDECGIRRSRSRRGSTISSSLEIAPVNQEEIMNRKTRLMQNWEVGNDSCREGWVIYVGSVGIGKEFMSLGGICVEFSTIYWRCSLSPDIVYSLSCEIAARGGKSMRKWHWRRRKGNLKRWKWQIKNKIIGVLNMSIK